LFELPCVAIGGITPENCGELVQAGADFLAVSHAVWSNSEAAAVMDFERAIAAALEEGSGGNEAA
jgi:thiamine-phosphate pyrophosphorylase